MHIKSQLFTLIGRQIILNKDVTGWISSVRSGRIVEKLSGMTFGVTFAEFEGVYYFDRSEFVLPPLRRGLRWPIYLEDDYDGFVYADVEGF